MPSDDRPTDSGLHQARCANEIAAVERALGRLLRIAEARRSTNDGDAARDRLDRAAYGALTRLEEMPATRLTELAAAMNIDLSTASRHVRALEARGFLVRIDDPDDQRTACLELTEEGAHALGAERSWRIARLTSQLAGWNDEDIAELARLLGQLVTSFSGPPSYTNGESAALFSYAGGTPT